MSNSTRILSDGDDAGKGLGARTLRATTWLLLLITACLAGPALAQQQEESPSIVELKAAAYDAQQAAEAAERAASQAQAQAAEAQAAIEQVDQASPAVPTASPSPPAVSASPPAAPASSSVIAQPAPAPAPVPAAPPPPVIVVQTPPTPEPTPEPEPAAAPTPAAKPAEKPISREEFERAVEKAEQAAAQAHRAMEELEAYKEQQKNRYARKGLYMSAGAFWAPEFFDLSPGFDADPSLGLSGGIGYRVHPHFSIDASFVWANGFELDSPDGYPGSFDDLTMWSALLGGRVIILTGKIQPYLGLGFGASGGRSTQRDAQGVDIGEFKEFGGTISFNGGFDLYLSDSVALGADAAVSLLGGDLSGLGYSTLGVKLIYRF